MIITVKFKTMQDEQLVHFIWAVHFGSPNEIVVIIKSNFHLSHMYELSQIILLASRFCFFIEWFLENH